MRDKYNAEIRKSLEEQFSYGNPMAVPRLEKIVVNMGVGRAKENSKLLDAAMRDLMALSGQKPAWTVARKSIANFKIREGYKIGCRVTLRRARMYEFLDRLISLVIPRMRDFRGLSPTAFDGRGNYSMGIEEQIVFPEVNLDKVELVQGMNITMVTSATTNDEARALLKGFGMPFKKPDAETR